MKRMLALWLCVLLVLPMVLSSCDIVEMLTDLRDELPWASSDAPTTTKDEETPSIETTNTEETTSQETVTSREDVLQNTPVESNGGELYNRALALLNDGKTEEAYDIFSTIQEYADVAEYLSRFSYKYTTKIDYYNDFSNEVVNIFVSIYNQYGNPLVQQSIQPSAGNVFSYSYQYDENQNLILEKGEFSSTSSYTKQYGYDEQNRPIWRLSGEELSTVEYDDAGNVIKRVSEYTGTIEEYLYDAQKNLIQVTYSNGGEPTLITQNEYDDKGQLIKTIMNLCPGETVITYTYDENGNLLLEDKMQSNGVNIRNEYQYDDFGNRIKSAYYSSLSNVSSAYYWEYDERGNVTKETREVAGNKIEYIFYYIYDAAGNCIKAIYEWDDYASQTEYEYDSNGNLVKVVNGLHTVEYSGYKLYYNPYTNVSLEDLDIQLGK